VLAEPHFLELMEGDYVDVLEWQEAKGLAVVRTGAEAIGFYSIGALKTEEQIFAEFRDKEDVELVMELENAEQAERDRESAYVADFTMDSVYNPEPCHHNTEGKGIPSMLMTSPWILSTTLNPAITTLKAKGIHPC
jgi:hypothetical protein